MSFGFTSLKVMHPMYSLMMIVESLGVLVRSVYVGYRIGWWQMVPDASTRESEAFQKRVYVSNRIADTLSNLLATVLYILYLVGGYGVQGLLSLLDFEA
ncbi:unnamed protein product [Strongylus vulgaris]|uniref:TLC domain-containing protein n=1 Tax=Strongylus vulgaris TaxID=40348 RepID=A0A3P7IRH3_STRVU|nr:unnamed protein product [Strongylus vulgaris]